MKIKLSVIILIFLLMFISGCATVSKKLPQYEQITSLKDGYAIVYIYRDNAYPLLHSPMVTIDDKKIFQPKERAYSWVYLKDGKHKIKFNWGTLSGGADVEFELEVKNKQHYYLKLHGSYSGEHKIIMIETTFTSIVSILDQEVAEKELIELDCRYVAPITDIID
ncbi:MAG: DUF2846 domain-containing protein [Candidatus Omnitrophota bacterium]